MPAKKVEAPLPVSIEEQSIPLDVTIVDPVSSPTPAPRTVRKGQGTTLAPTTTEAEDKVKDSQRHINLIWENTQSRIALLVVIAGILVNSAVVVLVVFFNREVTVTQLALISICLQFINLTVGIIIGFYFSRTNHSAQGGIGPKASGDYTGR